MISAILKKTTKQLIQHLEGDLRGEGFGRPVVSFPSVKSHTITFCVFPSKFSASCPVLFKQSIRVGNDRPLTTASM